MESFNVPPLWKDEAAVCIGGGPSLTQDQIDLVRDSGARVIAINNAYEIAPWADVLYACDCIWWDWHHEKSREFEGLKITRSKNAKREYPDLTWIEGETTDNGLSKDPSYIVNGRIGGYQAINLAVNFGANRILLIGYDMRNINNQSHWHGDHPNGARPFFRKELIEHFRNMNPDLKERNIQVINCTPGSAIDAFPFGDLGEEL